MPNPASAVDRVDLSGEPGVMGRADEFVEAAPDLVPLVRRLLGRYWLVDSFATAVRLAGGVGRGLNFVTVAGEAVLADGTLAVGPRQSSAGMLSRRSELRALRDEIDALHAAADQAQRDERTARARALSSTKRLFNSWRPGQANLQEQHVELRLRAASLSDRLAQCETRLASLKAEQLALGEQIDGAVWQRDSRGCPARRTRRDCRPLPKRADGRHCGAIATGGNRVIDRNRPCLISASSSPVANSASRAWSDKWSSLHADHAERDRALEETRSPGHPVPDAARTLSNKPSWPSLPKLRKCTRSGATIAARANDLERDRARHSRPSAPRRLLPPTRFVRRRLPSPAALKPRGFSSSNSSSSAPRSPIDSARTIRSISPH